jgi:hypothetical protein
VPGQVGPIGGLEPRGHRPARCQAAPAAGPHDARERLRFLGSGPDGHAFDPDTRRAGVDKSKVSSIRISADPATGRVAAPACRSSGDGLLPFGASVVRGHDGCQTHGITDAFRPGDAAAPGSRVRPVAQGVTVTVPAIEGWMAQK